MSFRLFYSKGIGRFIRSNWLTYEYDHEVGSVDPSILQIPPLAGTINLAWAVGANVYVKKIDSRYLESLDRIRSVLQKWYPKLSFSTEIIARQVTSNSRSNTRSDEKYGLLYTSGIDSLVSYLRHQDKKPNLFTVWGKGEATYSYNEKTAQELIKFSNKEGVKLNFVKTNVEQVIDRRLIHERFGLDWWENLSHAIVLTGSCAPPTCFENIGTLFIASGSTRKFNHPWGSHPLIDNNICWSNTRIIHDGYEMTRQEKIRVVLKKHVTETGDYPVLRVCARLRIGANCGKCEKCCRSIVGLILDGIDPNKCGFDVNPDVLGYVKKRILDGKIAARKGLAESRVQLINRIGTRGEWEDIQNHIPKNIDNDIYSSKVFFEWLRSFDIRSHLERVRISAFPRLILYSIFDLLAPFNSILPMKVRGIIRRVFDIVLVAR